MIGDGVHHPARSEPGHKLAPRGGESSGAAINARRGALTPVSVPRGAPWRVGKDHSGAQSERKDGMAVLSRGVCRVGSYRMMIELLREDLSARWLESPAKWATTLHFPLDVSRSDRA